MCYSFKIFLSSYQPYLRLYFLQNICLFVVRLQYINRCFLSQILLKKVDDIHRPICFCVLLHFFPSDLVRISTFLSTDSNEHFGHFVEFTPAWKRCAILYLGNIMQHHWWPLASHEIISINITKKLSNLMKKTTM